jgi:hypothetical protein
VRRPPRARRSSLRPPAAGSSDPFESEIRAFEVEDRTQVERVRAANRLIAAYCATDKRLTFIDVFPKMLGDDGHPRPELYQGNSKGQVEACPSLAACNHAPWRPRTKS